MHRSARLTGDLLARKGGAQPTDPGPSMAVLDDHHRLGSRRRALLGERDGEPPPVASKAGRDVAEKRTSSRPVAAGSEPVGEERARRVALTLRLDHDRHTRLRILAARRGRTGQDVLVEALDALLASEGRDCPCLRARPREA